MDFPTIVDMLVNIQQSFTWFWRFITAFTYFVGILFAVRALFMLKEFGQLQMVASAQASLRKPLVNFLVAVVLLYAPSTLDRFLVTLYGTTAISPYWVEGGSPEFRTIVIVMGGFVQFIGYIAFLRGWILLARLGERSSQEGTLARALMHIFGGILAINVFGTYRMLKVTLGLIVS